MAYTNYEILPPRQIQGRLIPQLYKLYRANGSFDLFMTKSLQHNCIQSLTSLNQAGVCAKRWNSTGAVALGEYTISTNYQTPSLLSIYVADGTHYLSIPHCGFTLVLNNVAGIFPYQIKGHNYSEHNAGSNAFRAYNGSSWTTITSHSNNWGGATNTDRKPMNTLWTFNPASGLSSIPDWKQYSRINVYFYAADTSKYTGASTRFQISFIHRFPEGGIVHRFYR